MGEQRVSDKMSDVIQQNQDILSSILDLERQNDITRAKIKELRQHNLKIEREKEAAQRGFETENSDFDTQIKELTSKQQELMDANQALSDKCDELESMNASEQQELEDIEHVFATEKERVCKEIRKLQAESPSSRFKRGVSRIIMSIRDDTGADERLRTAVQHGHEHHHEKANAGVDESEVEQEELEELENVFEAEKDKMCREIRKLQAESPDTKSKRDVSRIINKIKQDHAYEAPLRTAVLHGHEHHHDDGDNDDTSEDLLEDKLVRNRALSRMKEIKELEKAMR